VKFLGLHHVSINVSDLEQAAQFYTTLGLEPIPGANARVRWFRLGRNELHLIATEKPITRCEDESDYHLAMEVEDIQTAGQAIIAAGGTVLQEARQRPHDGSWYLFALDPDGNRLELTQHAPDWHLRNALVDEIVRKGSITQSWVEATLRAVPRHLFLPKHTLHEIYKDDPILTKQEGEARSSSSQPSIVTIMLEQLGLQPGERVLEIGAGTGWNAALMAHLVGTGGHVTTIDIDEDTVAFARENLTQAGVGNVEVIHADGGFGYALAAPYDAIIATAGIWDITPHWLEQLREDGRFLAPLWFNTLQFCGVFRKENGKLVSQSFRAGGFMPLRGEYAGARSQIAEDGIYMEFDNAIGVDAAALRELLHTPARELCVLALRDEGNFRLIDYLALTGEPLVHLQMTIPDGPSDGFALVHPGKSVIFLNARWGGGKIAPTLRLYGDDSTLLRLQETTNQWNERGRPGLASAHITITPKGTMAPAPGGLVLSKQWMEYHLTFDAAPEEQTATSGEIT